MLPKMRRSPFSSSNPPTSEHPSALTGAVATGYRMTGTTSVPSSAGVRLVHNIPLAIGLRGDGLGEAALGSELVGDDQLLDAGAHDDAVTVDVDGSIAPGGQRRL